MHLQLLFIGIATVVCTVTGAGDTVQIDSLRESRKIQLDGFLMEWSPATAAVWGDDTNWRYDAAVTPEGIAGYLRFHLPEPGDRVTLRFQVDSIGTATITLPDDSSETAAYFKTDRSSFAQDSTGTLEWLFPWPERYYPTAAPFSVVVAEDRAGKRTLPVLHFSWRYHKKKSGRNVGLIGRMLFIAVMGGLYLAVQTKIRNQNRRKEFPHRSA